VSCSGRLSAFSRSAPSFSTAVNTAFAETGFAPMVSTQIYLTEEEQHGLRELSLRTGRSQTDLIREAIDSLLFRQPNGDRLALLRQTCGLWSERTDLPDFASLRREYDRNCSEGAE